MSKQNAIKRIIPRVQDILFAGIFYIVVFYGPQLFNREGDLARHLTVGRHIVKTLSIPTVDIFSYTVAGKPWSPHEWLAEILFYTSFEGLGLDAIVILIALVTALAFLTVFRDASRRSRAILIPALLTVLGAAVSSAHWLARPHMLTMLFLALWTVWVEGERLGQKRPAWLYPALMAIWANTHGEFISGFLVLAAYLAGWVWELLTKPTEASREVGKRLSLISILSFLASLVNPVGLKTWETVTGYVANRYLITHTLETRSPDFQLPGFLPLLILIAICILVLGLARSRLPAGQVLMLAGFTAMSLSSARNVHLLGIVAPPILAFILGEEISRWTRYANFERNLHKIETNLRGFLWPVVTVLAFTTLLLNGVRLDANTKGNQFDPEFFPVQAVDWLEAHPQQGNMFNHFDWGGYVLLRLWPDQKVFIDSQTDVYGELVTRKYEQVIRLSPGWEEVLQEYNVDWFLIPTSSQLARVLSAASNWGIAYSDDTAIILVRLTDR